MQGADTFEEEDAEFFPKLSMYPKNSKIYQTSQIKSI